MIYLTLRWLRILIGLLAIITILIRVPNSLRDGITTRKKKVGWSALHWLLWIGRDVPVLLLYFLMWMIWWEFFEIIHWSYPLAWMVISLLFQGSHHSIYTWAKNNLHLFYGSNEPPRWFQVWHRMLSYVFFWIKSKNKNDLTCD